MGRINVKNLLAGFAADADQEQFTELLSGGAFRLERIVSTGQSTPPDAWYDQSQDEWVLVVRGAARIELADSSEPIALAAGDYVHLPAHCQHRVAWTDPAQPTVWLALHFEGPE